MARLTAVQRNSLIQEHKNGSRPIDLMKKYGITKNAFYSTIRTSKGPEHEEKPKPVAPPKVESESDSDSDSEVSADKKNVSGSEDEAEIVVEQPKVKVQKEEEPTKKIIEAVDNLIDFQKLNAPPSRKNAISDISFENEIMSWIADDNDVSAFDPRNLLKNASAKDQKPDSKFSVKSLTSGKGLKSSEDTLSKEEKEKLMEKERLGLVYQIRLYLTTFQDEKHLFCALNLEPEEKKINKFIQDLYKKKTPELKKVLDFIKFHIRNNNGKITGNLLSNIFFTIIKVLEMILFRMGINVCGLAEDMRNDKEVVNCLKEIEIESVASQIQLTPKLDLIMKLCMKSVSRYSENKIMSLSQTGIADEKTKQVIDKLNAKPVNESLQKKYDDL